LSKFNKNTAAELDFYREPHLDIINDVGKDSFISKPVDNEEMIHADEFYAHTLLEPSRHELQRKH
jgi:hypothetical protein